VGLAYMFQLQASLKGNADITTTVSTSFFVRSQDLVVVVRGGDVLTGEGSPLVLDAGESVDPDGQQGEIEFSWRCFPEPMLAECLHPNGTLLPLVMTGVAIPLQLRGGTPLPLNYTIQVTGRKGERLTQVTTRISVRVGLQPVPRITPIVGKVNPGETLRLQSAVSAIDISTLDYEWSVVAERSSLPLELIHGEAGTLECSSRFDASLSLRRHVLTAGAVYTFQLAARDTAGEGHAQLTVQINTPPQPGWIKVAPEAGAAYTETFTLVAPGWTDEDLPLWYRFACRRGVEDAVVLHSFAPLAGPDYRIESIVPIEGLPRDAHQVTAEVTVQDRLGATSSAEMNLTVWSPWWGVDEEDGAEGGVSVGTLEVKVAAEGLAGDAEAALRNADVEGALVRVDAAIDVITAISRRRPASTRLLLGEEPPAGDRHLAEMAALREELLQVVAETHHAMLATSAGVARFAGSIHSLTEAEATEGSLALEAQVQAMALLEGLVEDTVGAPEVAGLAPGTAQTICSSLGDLNRVARNASRATEVAALMHQLAPAMLDGAVAGETGVEVNTQGLSMRVERHNGADPASLLYTSPIVAPGATVSFPPSLAEVAARPTLAPPVEGVACNHTCSEIEHTNTNRTHQLVTSVDVDVTVLGNAVDPHASNDEIGIVLSSSSGLSSDVTTIELTLAPELSEADEDELLRLDEAVVFTLELQKLQGSAGVDPGWEAEDAWRQGVIQCSFWDLRMETYSVQGCTQLPNPAPAGAELNWRTLNVSALPTQYVESAWALSGNLTAGCVESFDATWPEYAGADAGLRKYLPQEKEQEDDGNVLGECQLARADNQYGCWWNWTHQMFSGPACILSEEVHCYCAHLGAVHTTESAATSSSPGREASQTGADFKAAFTMKVDSLEPPKVKVINHEHIASLSLEDVKQGALLLVLVFSIMASTAYLASVSAFAHNEQRRTLLWKLTTRHGTGCFSFTKRGKQWSWSLFEEDRSKRTKRTNPVQRMTLQRLSTKQVLACVDVKCALSFSYKSTIHMVNLELGEIHRFQMSNVTLMQQSSRQT
ncbi:hypothetical protein CYMTET_19478, partial [Cymbomonas tetramitiformis]